MSPLLVALLSSLAPLFPAQDREPVEAAPRVLVGSVRMSDGTAVPGYPVTLSRGGEPVGTATTDGDGAFALACPDLAHLLVSAGHVEGLRFTSPRSIAVGDGGERFDFEVRPVRTARFAGIALDERGRPHAGVELRVQEPHGPFEDCVTDGQGRFATTIGFAAGKLLVKGLLAGGPSPSLRSVHLEHGVPEDGGDPAPVAFEIELPERYELDFTPLPGTTLDDYAVRIVPSGLHAVSAEWDMSTRKGSVRAGSPPWTQPVASNAGARPTGEQTLYVLAEDGFSGAGVELTADMDRSRPLRVGLRPLGTLAVLVRDAAPAADDGERAHGVQLELTPLDGGLALRTGASNGTERLLRWLEPGRWRCVVSSPHYPTRSAEVDVVAGASRTLEIVLDPPLGTSTLRIRVAAADGDVPGWEPGSAPRLDAVVRSVEGDAWYIVALSAMCDSGISAWFRRVDRDGRFVYEAEIDDVPLGEYEVSLTAEEILAARTTKARAGGTALFAFAPVVPDEAHRFEVRSASGRPVFFYRVLPVHRDREPVLAELPTRNGTHAYALPSGEPVGWCVVAPGHRRAYGDRRAFEPDAPGYVARVELALGYSIRLVARTPDGNPVPGAELVFDGRTVTTDLDGRALLESDERHPRLVLAAENGWRIVGGDVDARGAFTDRYAELRVIVEPAR